MALFILPFDHRASFAKNLLGLPYPNLAATEKKKVTALKKIVFKGFLAARERVKNPKELAILIDEEFGIPVIQSAKKKKIPFALSVEKSGQDVFTFEYGNAFGAHLLQWKPTFAKALVRYDVRKKTDNLIQRARLKTLSDFCKTRRIAFLLELLVDGTGSRAQNIATAMKEIIHDGITPAVWKLEALETPAQWKKIRKLTDAKIIMLGRGENKATVERWVHSATKSKVVDGFAIGRTIFFAPLQQFLKKKINRTRAVEMIAKNYIHFIHLGLQNSTASMRSPRRLSASH